MGMGEMASSVSGYAIPGLIKQPLENAHHIFDSAEEGSDKYLLSFFEIFKTRHAGEELFSYLLRLGLVRNDAGKFVFIPKTRSAVLPVVCLYKTLNEKGYLKRMTQTEAGFYFCKAFDKNMSNIRLFYSDQLDVCLKYKEYFFHIPDYSEFIR
jgi:hypothetical protein